MSDIFLNLISYITSFHTPMKIYYNNAIFHL